MQNKVVDLFMHRMAATSELLADAAQEAIDVGDYPLQRIGELAIYRDKMRAKAKTLRSSGSDFVTDE